MRFFRFLLPLLAIGLMGAASKPKVTIRFHTQADASSGPQFTTTTKTPDSSQQMTISNVAQISESDILAIFPFPAANGSMGCAFKLDAHGRVALETLSSEFRGSLLFGIVNGRVVTAMLIDRQITDGIITISSGLTPKDIEMMSKVFPTLGAKKDQKAAPKTGTPEIAVPPPLPASVTGARGD